MKNYQSPWLAASILAFSFAGCAGLNDAHYEKTQTIRAIREYVSCGNPGCERFPHDYKLGWIDGFYNISTGGPTCPPAVAPERYWNPNQVLKNCDGRRHAYYSGWQDGASRASQFPDTHHLKIFETCECPMPRCESACGTGGCVPCGLGSVGSPVHAELIEMPYEQESIIPTPIVPPAPAVADEEESKADDMDAKADDDTAALTPATPTYQVAVPELEMLETESIEPKVNDSSASEELVRKSDASSIFGSAFDVIRNEPSTVRLQEQDPMKNLKSSQENSTTQVKPEPLETKTIKVANSEAKIVETAPMIRTVPEQSNASVTLSKDGMAKDGMAKSTIRLVEDNLIPPAIEKQNATNKSVANAKAAKNRNAELKQVTKKSVRKNVIQGISQRPSKPTQHPAVARETIPVRFEMIESDVSDAPATVVQAK